MFAEVKSMLPVSGDDYDAEIIFQIKAAALDLTRTAEIVLPGTISIERNPGTGRVTDTSDLKDELVTTAIAIWCRMKIGTPPDYDQLLKAYESLKGSLRMSGSYTSYGVTV